MKNLLILLISILLLSSFLTSCEKKEGTLYVWYEGDWVFGEDRDYKWMGSGDKDTHPKYQGQVKDGKPNGLGVIFYPEGSKYEGESKYVGSWKDGKPHGKGKMIFPWGVNGGSYFLGEWKDGKEWNGIDYNKKGIIENKWVNGKIHPIKQ